jgi:hypothetical protein
MNLSHLKKRIIAKGQHQFDIITDKYYAYALRNKPKIFCIGRNKTGTTSLQKAFLDLGYRVGNQRQAELIFDKDVRYNRYDSLIEYCRSSQVFQDVPFSHIHTLMHIDKAFPNSRFILSVRSSADEWYNSMIRFQIKLFGVDGRLPNADALKQVRYVRRGYMYENIKLHYGTPDDDLYNKEILVAHYEKHNETVLNYFKNRPNDLLVMNLSEPDAYPKMLDFLSISSPFTNFPWENKT